LSSFERREDVVCSPTFLLAKGERQNAGKHYRGNIKTPITTDGNIPWRTGNAVELALMAPVMNDLKAPSAAIRRLGHDNAENERCPDSGAPLTDAPGSETKLPPCRQIMNPSSGDKTAARKILILQRHACAN